MAIKCVWETSDGRHYQSERDAQTWEDNIEIDKQLGSALQGEFDQSLTPDEIARIISAITRCPYIAITTLTGEPQP